MRQRWPGARTAEMLFRTTAISAGVLMSVRAAGCGFGLAAGFGADPGAGLDGGFATLVRRRSTDAILSFRNCALSSLTSFFSFLIFLSFFDIA